MANASGVTVDSITVRYVNILSLSEYADTKNMVDSAHDFEGALREIESSELVSPINGLGTLQIDPEIDEAYFKVPFIRIIFSRSVPVDAEINFKIELKKGHEKVDIYTLCLQASESARRVINGIGLSEPRSEEWWVTLGNTNQTVLELFRQPSFQTGVLGKKLEDFQMASSYGTDLVLAKEETKYIIVTTNRDSTVSLCRLCLINAALDNLANTVQKTEEDLRSVYNELGQYHNQDQKSSLVPMFQIQQKIYELERASLTEIKSHLNTILQYRKYIVSLPSGTLQLAGTLPSIEGEFENVDEKRREVEARVQELANSFDDIENLTTSLITIKQNETAIDLNRSMRRLTIVNVIFSILMGIVTVIQLVILLRPREIPSGAALGYQLRAKGDTVLVGGANGSHGLRK